MVSNPPRPHSSNVADGDGPLLAYCEKMHDIARPAGDAVAHADCGLVDAAMSL